MNAAPQPLAEGNLSRTPLAHLLLSIEGKSLTGTLAVWPQEAGEPAGEAGRAGAGQDRILFRAGTIVAGRLLDRASSLDRGLLPLFRRTRAPYAFYEADLLGQSDRVLRATIDCWAIVAASLRGGAPEAALRSVLARHGERRVRLRKGAPLDRLALTSKEMSLVDLIRAAPSSIPALLALTGDPRRTERLLYLFAITKLLEIVPEGADASPRPPRSSGMMAAFSEDSAGAGPGRLSSPRPPPLGGFSEELPGLDDPPPMSTERGPGPLPSRSINGPAAAPFGGQPGGPRTRGPEGAPGGRPSGPPRKRRDTRAGSPPDPPPELPQASRDRWQEVAAGCMRLEGLNYYEMLEIEAHAEPEAVSAAYFEQVKRWHPDRLPPEFAPLLPWVERAFGHLTRANDTLRDPVERVRYREAVEDGGGTPEADRKLEAMLDAAMEFRKVEVLTRQRRYADAAALLAPILAAAPEEADYHAMMAMLLFEQHGATGRSEAEAILRYADEALRLAPAHERGLFTRGIALKQQGKMREAVSCFRRIVEANPKHTDAARELRLAQMRGDDKKGSGNWKSAKNGGGKSGERDRGGEPGGLLSKLFRKK